MIQIYPVACGDGQLAVSPIPGRAGAYGDDLNMILDWAPDMVLTLTTADELADVGAQGFAADLAAANIDWVHLPIEDFGTPGPDVQVLWPNLSKKVARLIGDGGRVLAHCYGGQGRSGMAVLRLLIEHGVPANDALARLRAVRPGAVETDAQMVWATEGEMNKK